MEGDAVIVKSFPSGQWKCGEITQKTGPVSYRVALPDGGIARRRVDHIKQRHFKPSMELDNPDGSDYTHTPVTIEESHTSKASDCESVTDTTLPLSTTCTSTSSSAPSVTSPCRSSRSVKKPAYLDDYVTP